MRHLVELHGGRVEVHSAGKGQGATFQVILPLLSSPVGETRESLERAPKTISFEQDPHLKGVHILVVDDDGDAAEMVATLLRKCGAEIDTARSAQAALEAMSQARYDVLISDLEMPGQHGYELMEKLRAREESQGQRILAIALTAHGRPEDRRRSLMAGYQAHVTKPVEPSELIALISSLVGGTA